MGIMSTGFKVFLVCIFFIWLGALVAGFYQVGSNKGAMEPLKYSPDVPLEKVIGWCIYTSAEAARNKGVTDEELSQIIPLFRDECEDRWLAFSKQWERGK